MEPLPLGIVRIWESFVVLHLFTFANVGILLWPPEGSPNIV